MRSRVAAALFVLVPLVALAATEAELAAEGRAALERGDVDQAVDRFEKAVAASPRSARAHHQLGGAYARQAMKAGMFSAMSIAGKMKDTYLRAVELDPDFLPARFSLIEFYTQAPAIAGCRRR